MAHWVAKLSDEEMPIFAHTARRMAGLSADQETSAAELAQVILQDSPMTARLLRMANSIYYNPGRNAISTVSRAVVVLGFDLVRNICLSIALVDTLLTGVQRERALEEMARSFHAAVQAKGFAAKRDDMSPEEVFIAALLYRLGHLAFWCFAGDEALALDEALRKPGVTEAQAEKEVLGFTLSDLTAELNGEWRLSKLLSSALDRRSKEHPRVSNVTLGHELAVAVKHGWDSMPVQELSERIAESLYMPLDATVKMLHANAKTAAETAEVFGAADAGRLIPLPEPVALGAPGSAGPGESGFEDGNPMLQLQILRELSALIHEELDLNALVTLVLEGMLRGIGMDRAVFAMLSADRARIAAKQVLGYDHNRLSQCFHFDLGLGPPSIVERGLAGQGAFWVKADSEDFADPANERFIDCVGEGEFFAAPVVINARPIGIFYADRRSSKRPLNEEGFVSFRHFCEQASLGVSLAAQKGRS